MKAIEWSIEMTTEWLVTGMLQGVNGSEDRAKRIVEVLSNHALTKSHARHLGPETCKEMGLVVEMLEDNQQLQEAVLSVHHMCILTLSGSTARKIVENHKGIANIAMRQSS